MENILIVDDNPTVVELIKYAVRLGGGYKVIVAYDGVQGLERVLVDHPDCVVIDAVMPKMDGYQLVRCLRSDPHTEKIPLIMLSSGTREEDQLAGFASGCDVYLTKPFKPNTLNAQVGALLRRTKSFRASSKEFLGIEVDFESHTALYNGEKLDLTPKEFALLECFLQHPRQVLTRNVILDHVWGDDFDRVSNVVDVYISSLRKKLEFGGKPRLIQTFRGVGYVLKEAGAHQ